MAGSERTRFGRGALLAAALLSAMSASDCGEFAHTNPFDPAVPVTLSIAGPDSAFAQFDTVHFTVSSDPSYDYAEVIWGGGLQRIDDKGTYRVPPIEGSAGKPFKATITVQVDSRVVTKTVDVVFRPAVFRARNCADDSRQVTVDAIGEAIIICTFAYDAHGGFIGRNVEIAPDKLIERSLDTTIVKPSPFPRGYTSVGNGTTSLVFKYGALADTVQVTVRQVMQSLTLVSPTGCTGANPLNLAVGQQIQLSLGGPARDRNGYVIDDPVAMQRAVADMRWSLREYRRDDGTIPPIPPVSVTPGGSVTAMGDGFALLVADPSTSGSTVWSVFCYLNVN